MRPGVVCVRVLLFAAYREAVGSAEQEIEVPEGSTVDDLYRQMQHRHTGLTPLRPYTTFARNREVVSPDTVLQQGDEVAFLQPVSGGVG